MEDEEGKGKKKKQQEADAEEEGAPAANKSDTLIFISASEARKMAKALSDNGFAPDFGGKTDKQKNAALKKKIVEVIGKPDFVVDGLDIALFGRMVAQATSLNAESAASFSHAISTHRVTNEVEFFTALDDCQKEPGSAHMGSLEFNSATYYRYIGLDLGQLWENLAGQKVPEAIDAFIKALYLAVPSARQSTQSGASPWEFARVYVRKGQRLQVPFETAVRPKNGGFLDSSKEALCGYLDKKEKLSGSLFGKVAAFEFGEDESFNVDQLIDSVQAAIKQV
jgi:CRISPR system Cascade subunit CasC